MSARRVGQLSTSLLSSSTAVADGAGAPAGSRVLVLSARFGGGHRSAAEAILHSWRDRHPDGEIRILEYFEEFVSPVTTRAASIGYTQSVRLFPLGYRLFYEATAGLKPTSPAQQWLNNLGRERLSEFLRSYPADVIVAVHPTPAGALSELKRLGVLRARTVTVVTDFVVHSQWIHPRTDLYLVGSDCVKDGLVRRGVPEGTIRVTGIPIRVNQELLSQREALREKWGTRPGLPTVLVMTGAQGLMRRPQRLFHTIASRPVQGFFVCGRDRALYQRLRGFGQRYPNFRVMPFVRIVPELMCVADVLISKAGGLTTSEALAMELPLIIFHPIPGQEYANRDYLLREGAALAADTLRELGAALDLVCADPGQLARMRQAIHRIRRPNAAQDSCREIERLLTPDVDLLRPMGAS